MDQRCRVCTSKFGIFKKEVECPRCRIALCKNCRSHAITTEGTNPQLVCRKCFTEVTAGNSARRSPPLNFKRELAAKQRLEEKKFAALDDEDLRLAERFHNLVQNDPPDKELTVADLELRLSKLSADEKAATLQELEYRLAKLKGDRPPAVRVHSVKKRDSRETPSSSRQVKNLIRQYTEEVDLEESQETSDQDFDPRMVPEEVSADSLLILAQEEMKREREERTKGEKMDSDIEGRLRQLQGMSPHIDVHAPIPRRQMTSADLSDEEELALIERLTAEAGLEVSMPHQKTTSVSVRQDEDELPWCVICNADGTLRCTGCDGDIYCRRCFKEGHDSFDLHDHKTTQYRPTSKMDCD